MRSYALSCAMMWWIAGCSEDRPARRESVRERATTTTKAAPSSSASPRPPPSEPAPGPMGALPGMARALIAPRIAREPTLDGDLGDPSWSSIAPIAIDRDWQGRTDGPETLARLGWTADALFVAFDCAFDELNVAEGEPAQGEVLDLYERDVVEMFVDESPHSRGTYREIEIDPRGRYLDIAVDRARRPRGDIAWSSGITTAARIDRERGRFWIEARIPAAAFGAARLAPAEWRINLYRISGRSPRTFSARFPTYTARPSFHVPDRFGWLRLTP